MEFIQEVPYLVRTKSCHQTVGWFKHEQGKLQFGTEFVSSADHSLVALRGASPSASTAAFIALEVVQRLLLTA
jgi:malate dehydrogenase (quinone)